MPIPPELTLSAAGGPHAARPAVAAVVVIGVCTAQRPRMLRACLDSIARQEIPEGHEVHLVVVDNEAEPNNEQAVARLASVCPFPVHYAHEPRRGIPIARNAVLDRAEELGADWVAFTDDDCTVAPDWLLWLVRAAQWYGADIIYGRQVFVCPDGKEWLMPKTVWHEGKPLLYTATHNTLISGRLFSRSALNLRFDHRMAHGSDSDFAALALKRGCQVIYSAKPVVYEQVPPERATFEHQMRLAWRYSTGNADRARRYDGWPKAARRAVRSIVWSIPVSILKLMLAVLISPLRRHSFKERMLKYGRRIMTEGGYIAGLFRLLGNPYRRKIDGY